MCLEISQIFCIDSISSITCGAAGVVIVPLIGDPDGSGKKKSKLLWAGPCFDVCFRRLYNILSTETKFSIQKTKFLKVFFLPYIFPFVIVCRTSQFSHSTMSMADNTGVEMNANYNKKDVLHIFNFIEYFKFVI